MPTPICIGRNQYSSRTAVQKALQSVIQTATLNYKLSGHDLELALEALIAHPDAEDLVSKGFEGIVVREHQNPGHRKSRCLYVWHGGMRFSQFSYKPQKGTQFHAAREAISQDMLRAKGDYFGTKVKMPCQHCLSEGRTDEFFAHEIQVHHAETKFRDLLVPPFDTAAVMSNKKEGRQYSTTEFFDPDIAKAFREYHNAMLESGAMRLEFVCFPCNMKAERKDGA